MLYCAGTSERLWITLHAAADGSLCVHAVQSPLMRVQHPHLPGVHYRTDRSGALQLLGDVRSCCWCQGRAGGPGPRPSDAQHESLRSMHAHPGDSAPARWP